MEYAVADSPQGVILQLGLTTSHSQKELVKKCYIGPRNWQAVMNT